MDGIGKFFPDRRILAALRRNIGAHFRTGPMLPTVERRMAPRCVPLSSDDKRAFRARG
jgi:hypothetical protein